MDPERTMQWMLEMQARHQEWLHQHEAWTRQHDVSLQRHEEWMRQQGEQVATLTDLIGRLAQSELRLVEEMRELRSGLNALVKTVDVHKWAAG